MPTSERGDFENPTKSAYSVERYESSWELAYMKQLERDKTVAKWTKNHGISIQYVTEAGNVRGYRPDFFSSVWTAASSYTRSRVDSTCRTPTRCASTKRRAVGATNAGCGSWW